MEVELERIPYDEMRKIAADFLDQHWRDGTLPVKIDEIAELRLNLQLVPITGLRRLHGVDAFLTADATQISVDHDSYMDEEPRCMFTIAHEVGHWVLHRDLIRQLGNQSVGEFRHPSARMTPELYRRFEYQANDFAGLVLVPPDRLTQVLESQPKWPEMRDIARVFGVSSTVINIRGQKDGHWF